MKILTLVLVLLATPIVVAAQRPFHVLPVEGQPSALLQLSDVYDGQGVSVLAFANASNCSYPVKLAAEFDPANGEAQPLPLRTDQDFALAVIKLTRDAVGLKECSVFLSFTPAVDQTYRLAFAYQPGSCAATVERWHPTQQQWHLEPTYRQRQKKTPVRHSNSPRCE